MKKKVDRFETKQQRKVRELIINTALEVDEEFDCPVEQDYFDDEDDYFDESGFDTLEEDDSSSEDKIT